MPRGSREWLHCWVNTKVIENKQMASLPSGLHYSKQEALLALANWTQSDWLERGNIRSTRAFNILTAVTTTHADQSPLRVCFATSWLLLLEIYRLFTFIDLPWWEANEAHFSVERSLSVGAAISPVVTFNWDQRLPRQGGLGILMPCPTRGDGCLLS